MQSEKFYVELDEGIRDAVRELHKAGITTTDSGDGSKWFEMACATAPHPHIVAIAEHDAEAAALIALDLLGDGWSADLSYTLHRTATGEYVRSSATILLEKPAPDSHEKQMRRMELGFEADRYSEDPLVKWAATRTEGEETY